VCSDFALVVTDPVLTLVGFGLRVGNCERILIKVVLSWTKITCSDVFYPDSTWPYVGLCSAVFISLGCSLLSEGGIKPNSKAPKRLLD
jgi:hypothetical protein